MNRAKTVIWSLSFLGAVILCLVALINLASSTAFYLSAERAEGNVSIGAGSRPFVTFLDRYGSSHISVYRKPLGYFLSDKQPVTVLYSKKNPDEVEIASPIYVWGIGVLMFLGAVVWGLLSFSNIDLDPIIVLLGGKPRSKLDQVSEVAKSVPQSNEPQSPGSLSAKQAETLRLSPELSANIFGPLKPLIDNKEVTDIVMASPTTIYVKKNNRMVKTDIVFPSETKYDQLVDRLLTVADNHFSIAKPIVDGMVTPMVRIHAVHKVLCEDGPYITLRISRFNAVRYKDLLQGTLAPRDVLAYLRAMLLTGHSILIAGEVGTGKTTLIRALASTIGEHESILVIEDTPEIKIEHPSVRYVRTRVSNIEGVGKVSPGECIKAGMRMAMNRIIFGEIRDPEAAESFIDACVSGHPGMSTIHSRSASDAVARLELLLARQQPGVDRFALKEQIGAAVQVIAYTQICPQTGQRRITEVREIQKGDDEPLKEQEIFRYSVSGNMPVWKLVNRTSFYEQDLKGFEGGSTLANVQEWLTFQ